MKQFIFKSIDEIPSLYCSLFKKAEQQSLFLSYEWFQNYTETIKNEQNDIRVFCIDNSLQDNVNVLLLPMVERKRKFLLTSDSRLEALSNYYTSYFSPILDCDLDSFEEIINAVVHAIVNGETTYDVVDINPTDIESTVMHALMQNFSKLNWKTYTYFRFGSWYLEVNERSYEQYFAQLPSMLQNTVKRKTRSLEKNQKLEFKLITSGVDVDGGIELYDQVYASSWKKAEPYPEFIHGLIKFSADKGWLRLGILLLDDVAVAAQTWIVVNNLAYIYKLSYSKDHRKYSVGTILTGRMMQHVIDQDKVSMVDFLTGDDSYKKDWMSHRKEIKGMVAFNPRTLKGRLLGAKHILGQMIKKNIKD